MAVAPGKSGQTVAVDAQKITDPLPVAAQQLPGHQRDRQGLRGLFLPLCFLLQPGTARVIKGAVGQLIQ